MKKVIDFIFSPWFWLLLGGYILIEHYLTTGINAVTSIIIIVCIVCHYLNRIAVACEKKEETCQ